MTTHNDRLTGTFLEICSCDVICGCCWLDAPSFETMTCSGISVWRFDDGSWFDNVDLSGAVVCCASTHRGTKSNPIDAVTLVFIDAAGAYAFAAVEAAMNAQGGPLRAVLALRDHQLNGYTYAENLPATISVSDDGAGTWQVDVQFADDLRTTIAATAVPSAVGAGGATLHLPNAADHLHNPVVGYASNLEVAVFAPAGADPERPDLTELPLINLSIGTDDARSASICPFDWTP